MIYVDKLKKYKRQSYCHMVSDVSIKDLHRFALRIGIPKHWFHRDHYDLRREERELVKLFGAIDCTSREIVAILAKYAPRRPKQENNSDT